MRKSATGFLPLLVIPAALAILLLFGSALSHLQEDRLQEGQEQLEKALRRSAAACYAAEGIYPPDLAYLEEHYGIQIDRRHYTVVYDAFASNLMPDITVLNND